MEAVPGRSQGLRSGNLRRPISLRSRDTRLVVESDSAVRSFDSLSERRALFGYEQTRVFKLQAGVLVQAQKPDWSVRVATRSVQFGGRIFEAVEMVQTLEFFRGVSSGYTRKVRLRNLGQSPIRLRVLDMSDPTAAQMGDSSGRWGSLGVNAFNRGSHVAMDEVSDPPSARVVGASPAPTKLYMTSDRQRAQDLFAAGDLPDPTAGMSGQVIVVSCHDFDLAPSESKELSFAAIYNPSRLEDALSDFGGQKNGDRAPRLPGARFAFSDAQVSEAAAWAISALEGAPYSKDLLDRLECLRALSYVDQRSAKGLVEASRAQLRRDGCCPHSSDPSKPGILETALLLQATAMSALMAKDRKSTRAVHPAIKKMAESLMATSKDNAVKLDPSVPQGWRRLIGKGYPTGEIPEVSLAVAGALAASSLLVRSVSKSDEAGRYRERAELVAERVRRALTDESGLLALCLDSSGRLRQDETIDSAVAAYRSMPVPIGSQASAHRLMDKDFETPYGPRSVPTSNRVYFNRTYGRGQLGGFWTRSGIAHAIVCYRSGMAGMGSLGLKKVAKLVVEDSPRLGGSPGEFPYWVDPEGGEAHGEDSDPVSAARFIEALIEGELGLATGTEGVAISPPPGSSFNWGLGVEFWAGEPTTAFVGRSSGKSHLFFSSQKAESKDGVRFAKSELLEPIVKGVTAVSFYGPGQVICIGSSLPTSVKLSVAFVPRAADLSKHLSTPLESYDASNSTWSKVGSLRVLPTMTFDASLGPEEWKAYRISIA